MPDNRVVGPLSPQQAIQHWKQIEALLGPLLAQEGNWEAVDILAAAIKGEMQFWCSWCDGIEAVMISTVIPYPRRRICHVPWIAGTNMFEWKDEFIRQIEDYARNMGCTRMAGAQREGWARVAGYRKAGVMLVKDLD